MHLGISPENRMPNVFLILCLSLSIHCLSHGFIFVPSFFIRKNFVASTALDMGDHSSATLFQVGDTVTVIHDVIKAGKNLKGLRGVVVETWEKCDVDPTCCCAEWVDEGLSVHVKFNVPNNDTNINISSPLENDIFVHYFAESELETNKQTKETAELKRFVSMSQGTSAPFDGLSCTAFKVEKLKMSEQAQRIASFEKSRNNAT
ncbi:hypothetical protein ACHAW6_002466 [Cyclotella cf. meneghiniana]